MKYIALLYGDPEVGADPAPGTGEFMQMLCDYQMATEAMADAGDPGRQQPAAAAADRPAMVMEPR
jgi:hypothetical protein